MGPLPGALARLVTRWGSSVLRIRVLGAARKCGTNCGSCVPELRGLVQTAMAEAL